MLVVTIIAFGLLLWLACLQGRNLLFPPALFTAIWFLSLIGLYLWGEAFYPVPEKAYLIYIVGASAFTLGGIFVLRLDSNKSLSATAEVPWTGSPSTRRALDLLLVLMAIGLPVYWRQISGSVAVDDLATLFRDLRDEQLLRYEDVSRFSIVLNLGGLAQFVALAMLLESNGEPQRRWRAITATILALIYGAIVGAKLNALSLVISLALIASVRARRLKLPTIAAAVAVALTLFSTGLVLINFAYESFGGSTELLQRVGQGIRLYWLSGLVAFGVIALNPNAMPSTMSIDRFFWDTAASLGAKVNPSPKSPEFTDVNLHEYSNVYTIYFSYFKDYGWTGTIILMFIMGAIMTLLYTRAMRGRPIAMILFGHLGFSWIFLSLVAEGGFAFLNTHLKLIIFLLFMYRVLPAFDAWRELARA